MFADFLMLTTDTLVYFKHKLYWMWFISLNRFCSCHRWANRNHSLPNPNSPRRPLPLSGNGMERAPLQPDPPHELLINHGAGTGWWSCQRNPLGYTNTWIGPCWRSTVSSNQLGSYSLQAHGRPCSRSRSPPIGTSPWRFWPPWRYIKNGLKMVGTIISVLKSTGGNTHSPSVNFASLWAFIRRTLLTQTSSGSSTVDGPHKLTARHVGSRWLEIRTWTISHPAPRLLSSRTTTWRSVIGCWPTPSDHERVARGSSMRMKSFTCTVCSTGTPSMSG